MVYYTDSILNADSALAALGKRIRMRKNRLADELIQIASAAQYLFNALCEAYIAYTFNVDGMAEVFFSINIICVMLCDIAHKQLNNESVPPSAGFKRPGCSITGTAKKPIQHRTNVSEYLRAAMMRLGMMMGAAAVVFYDNVKSIYDKLADSICSEMQSEILYLDRMYPTISS